MAKHHNTASFEDFIQRDPRTGRWYLIAAGIPRYFQSQQDCIDEINRRLMRPQHDLSEVTTASYGAF